jgi:hypothetical protein
MNTRTRELISGIVEQAKGTQLPQEDQETKDTFARALIDQYAAGLYKEFRSAHTYPVLQPLGRYKTSPETNLPSLREAKTLNKLPELPKGGV